MIEKRGTYALPAQHFGRRSLTLRALPQIAVSIQPDDRERVLFTAAAQLRLENLSIEHPPGASTGAPLAVAEAAAEITFRHCRLATARPSRRGETFAENDAPLLQLGAGAKVSIEHTLIVAHRRALAQFLPAPAGSAAELRVSDSAAAINSILLHEKSDAAGRVVMRRDTVSFAALLAITRGSAAVQFASDHCWFDGVRALVFAPDLDEAEVRRVLTWTGDDNAFHCDGAPLNFLPATTERTAFVPSNRPVLDHWRALFPGTELRSIEITETLRSRLARNRTNPNPITGADFALPVSVPNVGADIRDIGPQ